jgi:dihydrofolate reductase
VNRIEKHVVTRSLAEATWVTSALSIHRDGAVRALEEVVSATAGDVIIWGTLTLSRELFANDLVDELWLRFVPVSLGEGVQPLPRRDLDFDLLDCRRNQAGLLTTRYRAAHR